MTGWAIGTDEGLRGAGGGRDARDAEALAATLEYEILPCFYPDRDRYVTIMRAAISLNASFFNTQRMVLQCLYRCWLLVSMSVPPAACVVHMVCKAVNRRSTASRSGYDPAGLRCWRQSSGQERDNGAV